VSDEALVRLEFRACPLDEAPAAPLVEQMRREMAELYGGLDIDNARMPRAGATELGPPDGVFIVGFEHGVAVCCGGIKQLPDGACEIKRMFVTPTARGRGVARALLGELERRARGLGYAVARLDTGPLQTRARLIYERAGYEPVGNFNSNPVATYFGEKRL
jgi:GNAT superfamily N-acetyltransferase